ncbi:hypothetical protein TrVE_jg10936 [Triparma verrucosa]|uniref:2Fe-2S ferredoxin-type domain-containing protein n=1 Tax=Triparma verrucosa TaxID=1606542 RepID=A0A9W7BA29_9STRA|nr:hypothetical protein TrVE_jg10936 [Triparma verrucosa]
MHSSQILLLGLLLALTTSSKAFLALPTQRPCLARSEPLFGFFDKAFANEDLGAKQNAGLKNGPKVNDSVTINGKACKNAVVGQKIKVVAAAARVKIPYNCNNGDCGTCTVLVNGRKAKACQMTVPKGKCDIQT